MGRVTWKPVLESRESLLVMGASGTGKTKGWLSIADKLQSSAERSESPVPQMFVIETDPSQAARRALEAGYPHLKNVHLYPAYDWEDYGPAIKDARSQCTTRKDQYGADISDDWLVVDLLGFAWGKVEEYYIDLAFGKDLPTFFQTARDAGDLGKELDGRKDWGQINRLYNAFTNKVTRWPGHSYCTTPVKALDTRLADPNNILLYGPYGVMPVGQKFTANIFNTVLWMQAKRPGEWKMTTVKDREREYLTGEVVSSFFTTFLMKVAKWRQS